MNTSSLCRYGCGRIADGRMHNGTPIPICQQCKANDDAILQWQTAGIAQPSNFEQTGHALSDAEQAARRGKLIRAGTVVIVQTIVEHHIRLCDDTYERVLGREMADSVRIDTDDSDDCAALEYGDILERRFMPFTVDPQPSEADRHPERPT